jgi:hypothetical protein
MQDTANSLPLTRIFHTADALTQPAAVAASPAFAEGEAVLFRSLSRPLPAASAAAGLEERWIPARVRAVRADGAYDLDVEVDGAMYQRAAVPAADLRRPPPAAQPGPAARGRETGGVGWNSGDRCV